MLDCGFEGIGKCFTEDSEDSSIEGSFKLVDVGFNTCDGVIDVGVGGEPQDEQEDDTIFKSHVEYYYLIFIGFNESNQAFNEHIQFWIFYS